MKQQININIELWLDTDFDLLRLNQNVSDFIRNEASEGEVISIEIKEEAEIYLTNVED